MNRFERDWSSPEKAALSLADFINCVNCPIRDECVESDDSCEEFLLRWLEEEVD